MKNCHPDTARLGWELYKSSTPPPSLEVINKELQAKGHEPISDRMHRHYRSLMLHGYSNYMPINELDIVVKLVRRGAHT